MAKAQETKGVHSEGRGRRGGGRGCGGGYSCFARFHILAHHLFGDIRPDFDARAPRESLVQVCVPHTHTHTQASR
jgi:hypothetical protein